MFEEEKYWHGLEKPTDCHNLQFLFIVKFTRMFEVPYHGPVKEWQQFFDEKMCRQWLPPIAFLEDGM